MLNDQKHKSHRRRGGFALVVSLALMAFLLLLIVSLTVLVRVEQQASQQQLVQLEARALAHLAAMQALGELQRSAGPDQRVTAGSALLDASPGSPTVEGVAHPQWTGAWNVEGDDLLNYGDTSGTTERDAGSGNIQRTPRWLVSRPAGSDPQPRDALPGAAIVLEVEEAGLDVEAPYVELDTGRRYAWWIGDEGVKARINSGLETADEVFPDGSEAFAQRTALQLTGDNRIDLWDDSSWLSGVRDDRHKLLSDKMVPLLAPDDIPQDWMQENFFDYTTSAAGVLSDTLNGGLRIDLSRGLEEQWHRLIDLEWERLGTTPTTATVSNPSTGSEFDTSSRPSLAAATGVGSVNDADGSLIEWKPPPPLFSEPGGINELHGPSWNILYDYYQLHKPWSPYTPLMRVWRSLGSSASRQHERSFLGYASGRPPNGLASNRDWILSLNNYFAYNDWGLGLGSFPGLGNPGALDASVPLRPAGPAFSDGFQPAALTLDDTPFYEAPSLAALQTIYAGDDDAGFDLDRREPVWNALNPVLVNQRLTIALRADEIPPLNPGDPVRYRFTIFFKPTATLWNPYNARLETRNLQVSFDLTDFRMQIYTDSDDDGSFSATETYFDSDAPGRQRRTNQPRIHHVRGVGDPYELGVDLGRILWANGEDLPQMGFAFLTRRLQLQPGEVLVLGLPGTEEFRQVYYSDGRSSYDVPALVDRYYLSNQYSAGHRTFLELEKTPIYGGRPDTPDDPATEADFIADANFPTAVPDPNPADPDNTDPFNTRVRVSFFPVAETSDYNSGSFNNEIPESEMTMGLFARSFVNREKPGLLGNFAAKLLNSRVDLDFFLSEFIGVEVPIATIWSEMDTTSNTDSGEAIFLAGNPRAMNMVEHGTEAAISRHRSIGFEPNPPASFSDVQGVNKNGSFRGYFGSSHGTGGQNEIVLYDIPRLPLFSTGAFMHANLGFFGEMPNYAIGGSQKPAGLSGTAFADTANGNLPDLSYLLNEALFDRFFFSGLPPDWSGSLPSVYSTYTGADIPEMPPFETIDETFIEAAKPLPNPRLKLDPEASETPAETLERLYDLEQAASVLLAEGQFNINSTSVPAWEAVLASLGGRSGSDSVTLRNAATGGSFFLGGDDLTAAFPRFSEPAGSEGDPWRGYRQLSRSELRGLAEAIVEQVKRRGPFSSLADFVNRRLVNGPLGEKGVLEAAIEEAGLNSSLSSREAGLPGWLLQNDILRVLAPVLAARSDTFKIRAIGEVENPFDGSTSTARLELVVQRTPEYIRPDLNEPHEEPLSGSANEQFGRKFSIVEYRWLP